MSLVSPGALFILRTITSIVSYGLPAASYLTITLALGRNTYFIGK